MDKLRRHSKKLLIGIVGGLVVLIGLVLVPYPGPGWLIVFAGLAILATEFEFASRALDYAKGKYDTWSDWLRRQNWLVKATILLAMGVLIVLTVWLLNGFGIVNDLFNLGQDWVVSPLFR